MKNLEHLLHYNASAELAKRNLIDFVLHIKPDYEVNWHHRLLAEKLEKVHTGEIKRLMVFMPPQHGKSELTSRIFPAWALGKDPKRKMVLASYSGVLASSFNRACQRYMDTTEYREVFPRTRLSGASTGVSKQAYQRNSQLFEIPGYGGFLRSVGVGGSLTGTPADIAIIDDPVKDSLEADSPTYQYRNWEWFNNVLNTRLHNDSSIILIQTRWNENDLSGMILKSVEKYQSEPWEVLMLEAIKETPHDYDPRALGEALWEEKHSKKSLMDIRDRSIKTFQNLYQQNPQPTQSGFEFYPQFDQALHMPKDENGNTFIVYDPELPIHFTYDMNTAPYITLEVFQVHRNDNVIEMWFIDEFCLAHPFNTSRAVTRVATQKYVKLGHNKGLYIYGDFTKKSKSTALDKIYQNEYDIIFEEARPLLTSGFDRVVPNPNCILRRNLVRNMLGFKVPAHIYLSDRCQKLKLDMQFMKEGADGHKLKQKEKNPITHEEYEKYGHPTDALEYAAARIFPMLLKQTKID